MVSQNIIINLLNRVLRQSAKIRKETQLLYHCPTCKHSKRKLEISVDESNFGYYHCWVCNFGGKSFRTLFKKLNATEEQFQELYSITKDSKSSNFVVDKTKTKQFLRLPDEFKSILASTNSPEYKNALHYLRQRKLTDIDFIRYNIGYCESGEYQNRIIVPSYDAQGDLNFFCGRDYYGTSHLSYKLPPWSKNIIGFESFINWSEPVTLVEGVFDAIAVRNNSIPLFGKILSNKLKEALIDNKVKRVNVLLDNDAIRESLKIYEYLTKQGIDVHLIKLVDKDPSVLGFNKTDELIKSSVKMNFGNFILNKLYE